jgi:hypothetical protein
MAAVPIAEHDEGMKTTETHHVIDRRDGERVAGSFTSLEQAEAWIEKTDRRGSDEFEARETLDPSTEFSVKA